MPYSTSEGRPWMMNRLQAIRPAVVLDIGVGCGTYADALTSWGIKAKMIGIEVWEPYIERFNLNAKYAELHLADVREMDPLPEADVVILGDVLEHMSTPDAVKVWKRARASARRSVFLSIPIVHYPQGESEGNPFEEHVVDNYNHKQILATFPGITTCWTGVEIGTYEAVAR